MEKTSSKTGSPRAPRAELIAGKRRAIVLAAREHFLRDGFAGASMDVIAKSAGVSVKTVYSHFINKEDLFTNAMVGACTDNLFAGETPSEDELRRGFVWFSRASQQALCEAGKEYLTHLLSDDHLALYRVVTRDADRFPELGRQYHNTIARGRKRIVIAYLRSVFQKKHWIERDLVQHASSYETLLRANIFEASLHGLVRIGPEVISQRAEFAAHTMWKLLADDHR